MARRYKAAVDLPSWFTMEDAVALCQEIAAPNPRRSNFRVISAGATTVGETWDEVSGELSPYDQVESLWIEMSWPDRQIQLVWSGGAGSVPGMWHRLTITSENEDVAVGRGAAAERYLERRQAERTQAASTKNASRPGGIRSRDWWLDVSANTTAALIAAGLIALVGVLVALLR